jgi:hypothetical protein
MTDPIYERFRELSWRRPLTPTEQAELRAWLTAHPEAMADWEAEAELNEALGKLADVPVATNFTARVVRAAEMETAARARERKLPLPAAILRWLPRIAVAGVMLFAGLFSYHRFEMGRRMKLLKPVALVSEVSSLPSPEILKDFDAIRALGQAPAPDEELLALMQ